MQRELTCIICPNGCALCIPFTDGQPGPVSGAACPRGEQYALQELTDPRRTLTSSVLVTGGTLPLASVRLTAPVPRARLGEVMEYIRGLRLAAPVHTGQLLAQDLLGLGADLIATREVPAREG